MLLSNVSNRAKFYDKGITFRLQRAPFLSSNFIVSFPKHLQRDVDVEKGKRVAGQQTTVVRVEEPSSSRLKSV
jgi:hypothetical protein